MPCMRTSSIIRFSNIDKFSTAGLVTRMTTDVTNVQNAYQMLIRVALRSPVMLIFSMAMAFHLSAKLALIYLAAISSAGCGAVFHYDTGAPHFLNGCSKPMTS